MRSTRPITALRWLLEASADERKVHAACAHVQRFRGSPVAQSTIAQSVPTSAVDVASEDIAEGLVSMAEWREAEEGNGYVKARAWVRLDGRQVPIEVGIPAKVIDALCGDLAGGKRPWRADYRSGVAVRVAEPRKKQEGQP